MLIRRIIRKFARRTEGAILVMVAMGTVIFLGFVALSFDIGRVASTQSELQSFADHVALAAAGELDGGSNAITRATAAANNLITDFQSFGGGGNDLDSADFVVRFLSELPSDDDTPLSPTGSYITTDSAEAVYAWVVVNDHTVDMPIAAAFSALTGGTTTDAAVAAEAVAGFTTYACDITPMMFCIPESGWKADENVGQTILLRSGGSGAAWGPGDFGFLRLDDAAAEGGPCADIKSGANLYRCLLGAEGSVTRCFPQRGVDTEPGQKVGLTNGPFNTRFDMYKSPLKSDNALYPPAPNVIKGLVDKNGGACTDGAGNTIPSPDTMPLPPDDCFAAGTCDRIGDGDWSTGRTDYVATNYDGTDPFPAADTRWEYYKAEAGSPGDAFDILSDRAETGRPSCSPNVSDEWWDRRTLIAAGVNCDPDNGGVEINGQETGVPVTQWVKIFMLSPVGESGTSPTTFDMWVEVVESASSGSGGTGGVIHDVVQLYR